MRKFKFVMKDPYISRVAYIDPACSEERRCAEKRLAEAVGCELGLYLQQHPGVPFVVSFSSKDWCDNRSYMNCKEVMLNIASIVEEVQKIVMIPTPRVVDVPVKTMEDLYE